MASNKVRGKDYRPAVWLPPRLHARLERLQVAIAAKASAASGAPMKISMAKTIEVLLDKSGVEKSFGVTTGARR